MTVAFGDVFDLVVTPATDGIVAVVASAGMVFAVDVNAGCDIVFGGMPSRPSPSTVSSLGVGGEFPTGRSS